MFSFFRPKKPGKIRGKGASGPAPAPRRVPFVNVLLAIFLYASVIALLHSGESLRFSSMALGQRAPATVISSVDFVCEDVALTEIQRQQASDLILPVFTVNYAPYNLSMRTLDKLFDRIIQLRHLGGESDATNNIETTVSDVLDLLNLPLSPQEALALAPPGREEEVLKAIKDSMKAVWSAGIISGREGEPPLQGLSTSGQILIREPEGVPRGVVAITNLPTPEKAVNQTLLLILTPSANQDLPEEPLSNLLKAWLKPNLSFDPIATNEQRAQASKSIVPVMMKVRSGTTLMEERETITPQILERIRAHEKRLAEVESPQDRLLKLLGNAGLVLSFLLISIGILQILQPDLLSNFPRTLLLVIISLMSLLACKGVLYLSNDLGWISPWLVDFLIPLALAPLLCSILLGGPVAVVLGIWNSLITAVMFDNSQAIFAIGIVVTVVAVLASRDIRRRVHILRAGLSIGASKVLLVLSFAALHQQTLQVMATQVAAGLVSGVLSALLVTILIPLFESVFRITTDLTLLELSDMGHPLLQRLAMEAPGTYHHSLMVASLGQAAAREVGANALLVRICAYYHDIGKLAKPEFFSENTHLRDNPHDGLTPSMSTLVILSHVKEGLGLVQRYKLPRPVMDAIEQHHGTSMVSYFYHRARQQQSAEGGSSNRSIIEQDFRYPGPKPATAEIAILSLADAVEAASRSIEKPTLPKIENMVNDIVSARLSDGQLDECALTLAQLNTVKKSLSFNLANMLHGRTAYIKDENKTAPATSRPADAPSGAQTLRAVDSEPNESAPTARE